MGLGKVAETSRGNGHNDDVTIQGCMSAWTSCRVLAGQSIKLASKQVEKFQRILPNIGQSWGQMANNDVVACCTSTSAVPALHGLTWPNAEYSQSTN